MATTAVIDLTGMTPSPSPPQRSSCRASSSAVASSYLKRRDANAPSPYSSSTSSARKVIVYVYSSDDESEQVPPSSQGSNSGGIAARSSSSGGRFLEPDNDAVENEEEESILEFRSPLSRFAGPKAPPVKPAALASSSSSRRSRSPTKAGPSRATAAGQTTARRSGAQAATKRSASPSRPVEGNVASSSKTSPTKKRAKRTPKAAAAAAADAPSDGANTSPTKKSAAKPKAPALPPPPPPLDLAPFPNSKLLLLTMCPLCSHPFPTRQPAPTRRRHLSLCGSSKSISASVALAVLDDEIRRLDRLAQIEEQEKQMHETCWDFLVRSSGLGVRRTQDEEMWDALGLPQGSARRTECRRREEEADALAGVELGVRNASAEALKSARRWKRLDEGSRVCLLEKHAVGGRKRAHRCFVELCDGLYGGDEDEEGDGGVFDAGFDEPRALSDRPSSSMLPPATQSIRHRASRLAIRKGRGPNAGYGLGLHLPSRPSSSGKAIAR